MLWLEREVRLCERLDRLNADAPALFVWVRRDGEHVQITVALNGTISTTLNGVEQPPLIGQDYATAVGAVTDLMERETALQGRAV